MHIANGFVASPEFTDRSYLIYRMYEVGMGIDRLPRYREFIPDMTAMSGNPNTTELEQNTAQFVERFATRGEFMSKSGQFMHPSQAAALIDRWEKNIGVVLPTAPTQNPGQPPQYGRQELINKRLNGEFTVGQTLRAFVQQQIVYDKLFAPNYVTMLYFGFLRRDPDLNDPKLVGWKDWVDVLQNGRGSVPAWDTRHLIFGFIYSVEYRKRFGAP